MEQMSIDRALELAEKHTYVHHLDVSPAMDALAAEVRRLYELVQFRENEIVVLHNEVHRLQDLLEEYEYPESIRE